MLGDRCQYVKGTTIGTLADHIDSIIEENDTYLDVVSTGVYPAGQGLTRDQATIECQAWRLAFSEEGHKFARGNGFSGRSIHDLVTWIGEKFPLRFKKDPIPGWRNQVKRMRSKGNPHVALANYVDFMKYTAQFREDLAESCAAAEAEIDRQIDAMRGK